MVWPEQVAVVRWHHHVAEVLCHEDTTNDEGSVERSPEVLMDDQQRKRSAVDSLFGRTSGVLNGDKRQSGS